MVSTLSMVSVPYAIAPIACAPPILYIFFTPDRRAASNTSGLQLPPGVGAHIHILSTPATEAGIAFMRTDEG